MGNGTTQLTPTTAVRSSDFIESVLNLHPQLAVFDCDGTLWSGDAGERFFDWELRRRVLSDEVEHWVRARYADYKAGKAAALNFLKGQVMKLSKGKANPGLVGEILERKLK